MLRLHRFLRAGGSAAPPRPAVRRKVLRDDECVPERVRSRAEDGTTIKYTVSLASKKWKEQAEAEAAKALTASLAQKQQYQNVALQLDESKLRKPYIPDRPMGRAVTVEEAIVRANAVQKLTPGQQTALGLARQGRNLFITGSAGCGKSEVIRTITTFLDPMSCAVTAATGIAALNVNGTTLHSFLGITPNSEKLGAGITNHAFSNHKAISRLQRIQTLVIEEISMVSPSLLEALDALAQMAKGNKRAFGGIQMIVCGDFLQLTPTVNSKGFVRVNSFGSLAGPYDDELDDDIIQYAFESPSWCNANFDVVCLSGSQRHKKDKDFFRFLEGLRFGQIDPAMLERLESKAPHPQSVALRPTLIECERINKERYDALSVPSTVITSVLPDGTSTTHEKQTEHRYCALIAGPGCSDSDFRKMFTAQVNLKIGAQVILLKNLDTTRGLVNGAVGTVVDFGPLSDIVHPSDLMSLFSDHAKEQLQLRGVWDRAVVLPQDDMPAAQLSALEPLKLGEKMPQRPLPVVDFGPNVNGGKPVTIGRADWQWVVCGKLFAVAAQIPLRLAWAMTIHRSQGMSLDKVDVDLGCSFMSGQAYTALSRARTIDFLSVQNASTVSLRTHAKARDFMLQFVEPTCLTEQTERDVEDSSSTVAALRTPAEHHTVDISHLKRRLASIPVLPSTMKAASPAHVPISGSSRQTIRLPHNVDVEAASDDNDESKNKALHTEEQNSNNRCDTPSAAMSCHDKETLDVADEDRLSSSPSDENIEQQAVHGDDDSFNLLMAQVNAIAAEVDLHNTAQQQREKVAPLENNLVQRTEHNLVHECSPAETSAAESTSDINCDVWDDADVNDFFASKLDNNVSVVHGNNSASSQEGSISSGLSFTAGGMKIRPRVGIVGKNAEHKTQF